MPQPKQRELHLKTLDDVVLEVRKLHEEGYTMLGDWDLSQICQHLSSSMNKSVEGTLTFKTPLMVRLMRPFIRRSVFGSRRIPVGVKAPPGFEFDAIDERQAVEALLTAIERVRMHDGPWAGHPVFGKLSTEQWYAFHVIHSQHHLSFVESK